jgi:hypothetical protein
MTTVRVYFNGRGVDAPGDASALDALALFDVTLADAVRGGTRALVDSRGIAVDAGTAVYGGAIFRVVSARAVKSASEGADT